MFQRAMLCLLLLWTTPAHAGLSCRDIPALVQILDVSASGDDSGTNMRQLYENVQYLQWRVTTQNRSQLGSPREEFARTIMLLAADAERNDTASLLNRLRQLHTQMALVAQTNTLVHMGCPATADIVGHADRVDALRGNSAPPPPNSVLASMSNAQITVFVGLIVLAMSSVYLLARLYQQYQLMNRHRLSRFQCDVPCHFETAAADVPVTLKDINIRGARLEKEEGTTVSTGQSVNLSFGFRSIPAQIRRVERNEIGILFDKSLKPKVLFDILEEAKSIEAENIAAFETKTVFGQGQT